MDLKELVADLSRIVQNQQITIDSLTKDIQSLKQKRLYQMDFTPGCVKQAAMGEGNRFVRSGTASNLPTIGESVVANSSAAYFDTTNNKWYVYNSTGTPGWKSVTLS